jgi:cytochrome c oxidase subunit 2
VMILLAYVIIRFNEKANPVPSKTTHNWTLEIAWITIPTLIVLFISLFSMRLLYFQDLQIEPDMTLKVTGYQWYWGYEYPDQDEIAFNSYMIADSDIAEDKGERRLLSTDYPIVLPTDQVIQILITAGDVLHAWTVPAFGVKNDAIPGRLNESWVKIKDPGVYYGQCSELCGKDHAYMPIEVWAVPPADYTTWASAAEKDIDAANKALKLKMVKAGYKEMSPPEQRTFKETFFPAPEISEEAKAIMDARDASSN